MKTINAFIILLILLSITSCISDVKDADLPSPKTQLVVTGFISPQDETVYIYVGKTNAIYGTDNSQQKDTIKDANIFIHNFTDTLRLQYYPGTHYYKADVGNFKIEEGKTYHLVASTPNGLQAEGSCTIPVKPEIDFNVNVDSILSSYNPGSYDYTLNMDWRDPAGTENFYLIEPSLARETSHYYENPFYNYTDTSYYRFYYDWLENYVSDKNKDGKKLTLTNGKTSFSIFNYGQSVTKSVGVKLQILFTDGHYYKYNTSVSNFYGDDPFAEPVLVHTNIKNGFGTFSGYTKMAKIIQIK